MSRTTDEAKGKWRGLLRHFGINDELLDGRHHACPLCGGGKDRFRFDDKEGIGTWFCNACGAGAGMELLMKARGWDFARAAHEVDQVLGWVKPGEARKERTEEDKVRSMRTLLGTSGRVVAGTAAWNYLNRRCGDPGAILADIRAIPALRHSVEFGSHPAMLAVMRYPDGKGVSIHRTWVTPDGQKAPVNPVRKIMSGLPLASASVRLGPILDRIGIAEGIETAICAGKLYRLPVWSAISANGMLSWLPPDGVRSVVVFGDNDHSFTGQEASYGLAKKLRLKGYDVEVVLPPDLGTDFADVWAMQMQEVA